MTGRHPFKLRQRVVDDVAEGNKEPRDGGTGPGIDPFCQRHGQPEGRDPEWPCRLRLPDRHPKTPHFVREERRSHIRQLDGKKSRTGDPGAEVT